MRLREVKIPVDIHGSILCKLQLKDFKVRGKKVSIRPLKGVGKIGISRLCTIGFISYMFPVKITEGNFEAVYIGLRKVTY